MAKGIRRSDVKQDFVVGLLTQTKRGEDNEKH